MHPPLYFLAFFSTFLFVSCAANQWSVADKEAASKMSIRPVTVAKDAYQKPKGFTQSEDHSPPGGYVQTGSFSAGAAIGALSYLAEEANHAATQEKFETANINAIARAKASTPKNIPSLVDLSVTATINKNPLFQNQPDGLSRLSIEINTYGYIKTGELNNTTLVSPSINALVTLTDRHSKKLLNKSFTATSNIQAPLSRFISDQKLTKISYQKAIDDLTLQINSELNTKTGAAKTLRKKRTAVTYASNATPLASKNADYKVQQLKNIQTYIVTDKSPHKLTQGYSLITKAKTKVKIGGYTFKIAGTASGNTILIIPTKMLGVTTFSSKGGVEYTLIKNYLAAHNIKIIRQQDIRNINFPTGFFLELDGDGYSTLKNAR